MRRDGTVLHPPLADPPLLRPQLPRLKAVPVPAAQCREQRQHLPSGPHRPPAAARPPTATRRRTGPPASATSAAPSPSTATTRLCHLHAVRSLIPAAVAASVFQAIRFSRAIAEPAHP